MHILIESLSGFNRAKEAGFGRASSWYTSSPMVIEMLSAKGYPVYWLETFLEKGLPDRIGYAAFDAVHALKPHLERIGKENDLPGLIHFVASPLQRVFCSLVYKQAVLQAWLHQTKGRHIVVGDPTLSPSVNGNIALDRFDTLFALLAAQMVKPNVELLEMKLGERGHLYREIDRMIFMDRIFSIADFSLSQLAYRMVKYLAGKRGIGTRKGRILVRVIKDNELIREMVPYIMLKGGGIKFEKPVRIQSPEERPLDGFDREPIVEDALQRAMEKAQVSGDFKAVGSMAADRLRWVSRYWRPFFQAAEKRVTEWLAEDRPQIILSNTISGPGQVGLALAARSAGIPVCVVEHGVSAGLSYFHKPLRPFSEASICDLYLACSANTVEFNDGEPVLKGKSVAVGLARQVRKVPLRVPQRFVVRRKLRVRGKDQRVVIYLTRACQNNMRFLPHSPEDRDVHRIEKIMVDEVMPRVRGVPVIKFYNTRRHWDEHPLVGLFRASEPVRTIKTGDFRFLRAGIDIIILQSPLSTLGWALGTGRPIFYLEQPELKLLPHAKRALSSSLFMFSTEMKDWPERLLSALNRPDEDILREWKNKEKARNFFLRQFVFGPPEAGRRATEVIMEKANFFFSKRRGPESAPGARREVS
ncbi:MAG: hypothetical protein JRJ77_13700 [Deltaproteobacteria bacterium]|nr:hypothetical protein [Deltaproteobacteria bacterium]